MKKSVVIGIVVLVVVVAGGAALAISHSSNSKDKTMANMPDMPKTSSQNSSQPSATNSVTINDFAFSPAHITVKKGTTVTWTNKDTATHNVTETDGKAGPKSTDLATGDSYTFTYNQVGSFSYACTIHPNMVGSVVVTE